MGRGWQTASPMKLLPGGGCDSQEKNLHHLCNRSRSDWNWTSRQVSRIIHCKLCRQMSVLIPLSRFSPIDERQETELEASCEFLIVLLLTDLGHSNEVSFLPLMFIILWQFCHSKVVFFFLMDGEKKLLWSWLLKIFIICELKLRMQEIYSSVMDT